MLDLLQRGLLIELFCAENGHYPQSIQAIAAGLGGSVPVDLFSGEPYHYVVRGDTFLLYSVGHNRQDDGGSIHDPIQGDIVWRGEKAL